MHRSQLLVLNAGSSTLKYKLFPILNNESIGPAVASGLAELGNSDTGRLIHHIYSKKKGKNNMEIETTKKNTKLMTHKIALEKIVDLLCMTEIKYKEDIKAIGHRVVHGGEEYSNATLINSKVKSIIENCAELAPLHNPPNLVGINVAEEIFGNKCPQVAVFDTAFHTTMPPHAYLYGLPYEYYTNFGIRKYGFHGTSHSYIASRAAEYLKKSERNLNIISCHLGNGASMCLIKNGKSIDTTMGFTPLEGLIMGTRSGDIDAAIYSYLSLHLNKSPKEMDTILNKKSGLKGICGDHDVRRIKERSDLGDKQAELALNMMVFRIRKYLGAYLLQLGGTDQMDGIVFTAGIGENASYIREAVCRNLQFYGIKIDSEKNNNLNDTNHMKSGDVMEINAKNSNVKILVIPTDEEYNIAKQTFKFIKE